MKKNKRLQVISVLIASVLIILLLLVFPIVYNVYKPVNVVDLDPCLSESSRKPVTYADFFNHDLAVIEERGVQADLVLVGASTVYRSFIPQEIENNLDVDVVINGGTSAQPSLSSYYMLHQLINRFHPKYAVVGITWWSFTSDPMEQGVLIAGDYMPKLMKMVNGITQLRENDWTLINDNVRFSENADKEDVIWAQREALVESGYSDTEISKGEYYSDTGFVYSTIAKEQGNIEMHEKQTWKTISIKNDNLKAFDKICKLCTDNDVKLYFVMAPTSMMRTYGMEGYDEANEYIKEYAASHNAVYFDLNLMRDREKTLPDSMMKDFNHVNGKGAKIVSNCLANCIRADINGKDVSTYLYDSLDGLKADCHRIVSVKADIAIDGNIAEVRIDSRHNKTVEPLYKVMIASSDGEYKVAKDWSTDNKCDIAIPVDTSFSIKVLAAESKEDSEPAWMTYAF